MERANAGDADGMADFYELDAVMVVPPCQMKQGREAIRAVLEEVIQEMPTGPRRNRWRPCAKATWP